MTANAEPNADTNANPSANPSADRVARAACQRLLAASQGLAQFAALAGLTAFAALWVWAGWIAPRLAPGAGLLAGSLLAGLVAVYYGFRLRLDAELFGFLGEPGPVSEAEFAAGMDQFRACLFGRRSPGGALGPRYAGALRLWRRFGAALGLQVALLAGATGAACLAPLVGG